MRNQNEKKAQPDIYIISPFSYSLDFFNDWGDQPTLLEVPKPGTEFIWITVFNERQIRLVNS